jgi:hypothetical protein
VIDDQGTVTTDPLKVLQVWRDYVQKLGRRSQGDRAENDSYNASFAAKVMAGLRPALCDAGGSIPELEDEITWEEVHAAIRRLPNGKAPGPDGIVGELLRLAGLGFEFTLAGIFNDIWRSLE